MQLQVLDLVTSILDASMSSRTRVYRIISSSSYPDAFLPDLEIRGGPVENQDHFSPLAYVCMNGERQCNIEM